MRGREINRETDRNRSEIQRTETNRNEQEQKNIKIEIAKKRETKNGKETSRHKGKN